MFTTIIIDKENSRKIPLNASGKNTKENLGCTKADWENLFSVFEDINGKKYVLCHGTRDGYLAYKGFGVSGYNIYDSCVNRGFINDGESITIICCYGKTVAKETAMCSEYYNHKPYNFTFLNTDALPMTVSKTILRNGFVRLNLYTNKNKLEAFINRYKASY